MPPKGARQPQLRACLVCSILQSQKDFIDYGCPNCEEVMDMRGSAERVVECTSTIYDGMIAMMEPEESWVARWQRIGKSRVSLCFCVLSHCVLVTLEPLSPVDLVVVLGSYRKVLWLAPGRK